MNDDDDIRWLDPRSSPPEGARELLLALGKPEPAPPEAQARLANEFVALLKRREKEREQAARVRRRIAFAGGAVVMAAAAAAAIWILYPASPSGPPIAKGPATSSPRIPNAIAQRPKQVGAEPPRDVRSEPPRDVPAPPSVSTTAVAPRSPAPDAGADGGK
jgi:hypothetical protein